MSMPLRSRRMGTSAPKASSPARPVCGATPGGAEKLRPSEVSEPGSGGKARERDPPDHDVRRDAFAAARIDRGARVHEVAVGFDARICGPAERRIDRIDAQVGQGSAGRSPAEHRTSARIHQPATRYGEGSVARVDGAPSRVGRYEVASLGRRYREGIEREVRAVPGSATSPCCGMAPGVNARRTSAARSEMRSNAAVIVGFRNTPVPPRVPTRARTRATPARSGLERAPPPRFRGMRARRRRSAEGFRPYPATPRTPARARFRP